MTSEIGRVTTSREGGTSYNTDCLSCSEVAAIDHRDGAAHRRWALRHVNSNPGHRVHVERVVTRVYESDDRPYPPASTPEEA
ncbi:MAG: hypothetical protein HOV97_05385 [Nonomuraea sp.]|nr:hypothetical protein [Nonomuraea sp.]